MLVYLDIYLPKNLESFLKGLAAFSFDSVIPNIGQKNHYAVPLDSTDVDKIPTYFGRVIVDQKA